MLQQNILLLIILILWSIPYASRDFNHNQHESFKGVGLPVSSAQDNNLPSSLSPGLECGYHANQNASNVVANSSSGQPFSVVVGYPSWLQVCHTVYFEQGSSSVSFVGYEVFPVTVIASPGVTFTLMNGSAIPSAEQIAIGIRSNPIWTEFDPVQATTDSNGTARSNFTLAGAVMPFVPNNIANVSLPITAQAPDGSQESAGLPIEFTGWEVGGDYLIHVVRSPGPLQFSGTLQGSPGNPSGYAYGIVYAPIVSSGNPQTLHVNLSVVGTWSNGAVGPPPQGVKVTVSQTGFDLTPGQVFYFWFDENNTLASADVSGSNSYVFAIQETVGNSSYLEPLAVSISNGSIFPPSGPPRGPISLPTLSAFAAIVIAAASSTLGASILMKRRRLSANSRRQYLVTTSVRRVSGS